MTANPPTPPRDDAPDAGEAAFAEYFRRNYPGPDTTIMNPDWHAPRIYRAAVRVYEADPARYRASLTTPGPDAGKVKPLDWNPAGYHGQDLEASAFGVGAAYRVTGKPGDWTLTSIEMREYVQTPGYQTRADAQAAAQVDFERRILAELTPAAHTDNTALVEAWPRWRSMLLDESPLPGAAIKEIDAALASREAPPAAQTKPNAGIVESDRADQTTVSPAAQDDVERVLLDLIRGDYSSISIGFNNDHACNYANAQKWHDEFGGYRGDEEDRIDWVSEEERMKAISENSVWTVQWYPDTPVGFNCIGASTLSVCLWVVGYLGDWRRAAAVFFDGQSLSGDPAPRRETGAAVAALTSNGVGTCGADDNQGQAGHLICANSGEVGYCLTASAQQSLDAETETLVAVAHTLRGDGFDASEDGTARGTPLVPVAFDCKGTQVQFSTDGSHPTLRSMGHSESHQNAGGHAAVAFDLRGREGGAMPEEPHETASIRAASGGSSRSYVAQPWAVRRLTPRECERLQAFPDDFTRIPGASKGGWRDVDATEDIEELRAAGMKLRQKGNTWRVQDPDGPRYKALGNSWAVNCAEWIGARIAMVDSLEGAA